MKAALRGMVTSSGVAKQSKYFCLPCQEHAMLKGNNLLPQEQKVENVSIPPDSNHIQSY